MGGLGGIDGKLERLVRSGWTGQGSRPLGRARSRQGCVAPCLGRSIFEEGANAGELARSGRGTEPLAPPAGKKCPQVRRGDLEESRTSDLLTAIPAKEADQPVRRGDISANRVR